MSSKLITLLFISLSISGCSWNKQPVSQQITETLPTRDESVSFLSQIHRKFRDSERASYDMIYGIRDGIDSFVYDVEKDYYQDYQK